MTIDLCFIFRLKIHLETTSCAFTTCCFYVNVLVNVLVNKIPKKKTHFKKRISLRLKIYDMQTPFSEIPLWIILSYEPRLSEIYRFTEKKHDVGPVYTNEDIVIGFLEFFVFYCYWFHNKISSSVPNGHYTQMRMKSILRIFFIQYFDKHIIIRT